MGRAQPVKLDKSKRPYNQIVIEYIKLVYPNQTIGAYTLAAYPHDRQYEQTPLLTHYRRHGPRTQP
jgi:hypothetical protein